MREKEVLRYGGITPLISQTATVREDRAKRTTEDTSDTNISIKKFLMQIGYSEVSADILNITVFCFAEYLEKGKLSIGKVYGHFSKNKPGAEAVRAKLTYYINKNYDRVRKNINTRYGCDMGENFGNKNFIIKIASVYDVFVKR